MTDDTYISAHEKRTRDNNLPAVSNLLKPHTSIPDSTV